MSPTSQTAKQNPKVEDIKNFYAFKLTDIDGKPLACSKFEGKVVLVVNTASQCGLTPQYDALQKIYDANKSSGFAILGVPSNDFGQRFNIHSIPTMWLFDKSGNLADANARDNLADKVAKMIEAK